MKSIINNIHLQFRCPVLQFDIESVDWDFNSKAGLWTIAHSKVKEIAFEYDNPSNGQATIVHLLVTNVENDHLVNITLISDINGPQYSHSKFFCSLDSDCNVIKVAYEDCVSGEIKELVEKEEVDTIDEYVEALEDDDEEEIDIMEFSPVDQCTSDLDYDQFISLLFTLDGLLDIMHCGNVKIVTTDEEAEVGRLYIYPPTNDYTPSKIAASKRFSTDVGSFNLDALLTNELYI